VSGDLWKRAAACARDEDLPVHAHCAQSLDELRRVTAREGKPPMAWLTSLGVLDQAPRSLLVHCLYATRAELAALDPTRHALAFCPYSQLIFGFPADVGLFSEVGVPWLVATDCAASNDSMNVQKELRFAAGRRTMATTHSGAYGTFLDEGGVERAEQVWATRSRDHAARLDDGRPERLLSRVWDIPGSLHPRLRAGVIAPQALANLVVWDATHPSLWPDTDPLRLMAMGDTSGAIHTMFVAGKQLGRPGDFHRSLTHTDEYEQARGEANERLQSLMEAAGS
jgi:cytosine/adenosine deaminase-related metal-dependent hydrolase